MCKNIRMYVETLRFFHSLTAKGEDMELEIGNL